MAHSVGTTRQKNHFDFVVKHSPTPRAWYIRGATCRYVSAPTRQFRGRGSSRAARQRQLATARVFLVQAFRHADTLQHVRPRAYLATRHFIHSIEGRSTTLRTDHRPLSFMFSQKAEKLIHRQARHIAFLSQYFDEIEHVSGERNTVPDRLPQLEVAIFDHGLPDLDQWAIDQASDTELQDIITGKKESSLELDARQTTNGPVYFDIAHNRSRLFVPQKHRRAVFTTLHQHAHGGSAATARIFKDRFVWPGMDREIWRLVKMCEQCQKVKVHKHTTTPLAPFASPDRCFCHIHLDLVGPLPSSNNAKYLLTFVDRFTR